MSIETEVTLKKERKKCRKKRVKYPIFPCPRCGEWTAVDYARRKKGLPYPHRKRVCPFCQYRFTTAEKIVENE